MLNIYLMAKTLIENKRYVEAKMKIMIGNYLRYEKLTQTEYDELVKLINKEIV